MGSEMDIWTGEELGGEGEVVGDEGGGKGEEAGGEASEQGERQRSSWTRRARRRARRVNMRAERRTSRERRQRPTRARTRMHVFPVAHMHNRMSLPVSPAHTFACPADALLMNVRPIPWPSSITCKQHTHTSPLLHVRIHACTHVHEPAFNIACTSPHLHLRPHSQPRSTCTQSPTHTHSPSCPRPSG